MDIKGNIKHFRGIQREGFCPVGRCVFSYLSEDDGMKLAQAVKALGTEKGREIQIKFVVTAYSSPKYVTASIEWIGKDIFIKETEVDIDAWEAFVETPLVPGSVVAPTKTIRLRLINYSPAALLKQGAPGAVAGRLYFIRFSVALQLFSGLNQERRSGHSHLFFGPINHGQLVFRYGHIDTNDLPGQKREVNLG